MLRPRTAMMTSSPREMADRTERRMSASEGIGEVEGLMRLIRLMRLMRLIRLRGWEVGRLGGLMRLIGGIR